MFEQTLVVYEFADIDAKLDIPGVRRLRDDIEPNVRGVGIRSRHRPLRTASLPPPVQPDVAFGQFVF